MRILINDHAGHPFQVQLSRNLASRGHSVLHTFTGDLQTPRGALQRRHDDPETFGVEPVVLSRSFNRYGLIDRFKQERELGRCLKEKVKTFRPDAVISANTPLGAQAMLVNECRAQGMGFVFWLQDMLGVGIRNNLKKKLSLLGSVIGRYYMGLEHRLLKQSGAVVVITEDFSPIVAKAGVDVRHIHVIHNWAPLNEVPVLAKENDWCRAKRLDGSFNFIYSGTLGMKHNPGLLVALAKSLSDVSRARLVVISEGLGAEYLAKQKKALGQDNLLLLPFQSFDQLPQVQAAADVLVAILEADAGVFAVPSKVLTYMCAKRPLLLAVPPENLAARIVKDTGAGVVVGPGDTKGFIEGAHRLMKDQQLREAMADRGRMYAETHFDIEKITDRFEGILERVRR
jgi:colanic acid biosynthesis glycosyl transferase WcaI